MKSCGTHSGYVIHNKKKEKPCDPCRLAANKYRREKRALDNSKAGYDPRRFKRHGITKEEYEMLLSKYDGKCWICKDLDADKIDHDHRCCEYSGNKCGKCVRGVLCHKCNTAIGLLNDNKEIMSSAIEYLEMF